MMRHLVLLAALLLMTVAAQAQSLIWAGLFFAENRPTGPQAPPRLTLRLQQVFGYSNYKLLKGEDIDLRRNWPHWVLARKDFFLRIDSLPHPPDEPDRLGYEIYKDGFIVAKGRYFPDHDTPLFISGPDLQHGRLIFVVEAR